MNIIEKRKGQFSFIAILMIAISVILAVAGVILLVNNDSSVLKIIFGIILTLVGLLGLGLGIFFSIMASSVKATKGSIAEDIAGKGTVNMHKCENCGAEVAEGTKICAKCEENLKP